MGSVCADQHKIHHSHQLFLSHKTLREVDIPPRKYLSRRATAASIPTETVAEFFMDSPKADEALLQKFLPYNNRDEADEADPYSSDHFRMYEFKVRRCTRSRSHDWTDCPFAHPGEKARRRDPRKYHYSGMVCSEFRRGSCSRGDSCEFAHGVFECWLHPARYRTEACKDGKNCKRKVCFFAHSPRQLRVLPSNSGDNASPANSSSPVERKYRNATHCCLCCHPVSASPTSTLMGMSNWSPPMSPSLSPPLSPAKTRSICGFSPISRYADRMARTESGQPDQLNYGMMSYKDALTELMSSLESMNANESSHAASSNRNLSWVDVNFNNYDHNNQFTLSPSTVSPISSGSGNFFAGDSSAKSFIEENGGLADPDLGWVNELLT